MLRLVLAEDDVDLRELLAESLRLAGYRVEEVGDGREALAAIMRECPEFLITDCNMPNMTGNELVAHLALDARLCTIPAIVISATKRPSLPANVVEFLAKPFAVERLHATIRDHLATNQIT